LLSWIVSAASVRIGFQLSVEKVKNESSPIAVFHNSLFPFEQMLHTRSVVALRHDAGDIDHNGIDQHDPGHERRREKPEQSKGKQGKPVREFPPR
jgi:hypothetical protein